MNTTQAPSTPLGAFGVLPPELRNAIYTLALVTKGAIFNQTHPYANSTEVQSSVQSSSPTHPLAMALLGASKAFADEATIIAYSSNNFEFDSLRAFSAFMEQIGDKASMVTLVEIPGGIERSATLVHKYLKRMTAPKLIKIWTKWDPQATEAAEAARYTWAAMAEAITNPREEVQIQRLAAFELTIPGRSLLYMGVIAGVRQWVALERQEAQQRLKALLDDLLRQDAERAKRLDKAKQEYIDEKLRAVKVVKQS